ncbi:MAG: 30S ribosomal protein S20 [Bacilli bacterium]|nr:30S ribosomal protein S20 [Bacilli bacterium]MDD4809482.1 30S ribosomal protein S20 [Bacilli bacterium]
MANMKNAEKRVRVAAKQKQANNEYQSSMKTAIKNVEKAILNNDKVKANDDLKVAIKRIDKATKAGVITKNASARYKSNLTKKVNAME